MATEKRLILLATIIVVTGCSTQPRAFDARFASPPADSEAYARDFAACQFLVRSNSRSNAAEKTGATLASIFTSDGISVAKAIRADREELLKSQMTACLAKSGYSVSGWQRASKLTHSKSVPPPVAAAQTADEPVVSRSTKTPRQ